jgi:hypothetical protein
VSGAACLPESVERGRMVNEELGPDDQAIANLPKVDNRDPVSHAVFVDCASGPAAGGDVIAGIDRALDRNG